jgi:spermidine/putrescine transport system permease protein
MTTTYSSDVKPAGTVRRRTGWSTWLLASPPFLFLLLLFVVPVGVLLMYSFGERAGFSIAQTWTVAQYREVLSNGSMTNLLFKTVWVAALSTIICLLIGFPAAWAIAHYVSPRWQRPLLLMLILPSWTSFVIRVYSLILLLGDQGLVNSVLQGTGLTSQPVPLAFNMTGVLVGLVYVGLPWMILPVHASIERLDRRLVEASRSLGAGNLRTFFTVILPLTMPGIVAGVLMTFIPAVGTFVISAVLGGREGFLYTNLIDTSFANFNWPLAAAMSVILLVVTLMLVGLLMFVVRKTGLREIGKVIA